MTESSDQLTKSPVPESRKPFAQKVRDALYYRALLPAREASSRLPGFLKHAVWRRVVPFRPPEEILLHVGSGREALPGWVNIDIQQYLEVDIQVDVTRGLPYSRARKIFSEHFIEHLDIEAALAFFSESNRVLVEDGWLRLTTPNLDWVWTNVYSPEPKAPNRLVRGIHANRSFYGWRHRFLWNRELLETALRASGFSEIRWCDWGESELPEFQKLERHEQYPDTPELPHILVVEARKGDPKTELARSFMATLRREFLDCLHD